VQAMSAIKIQQRRATQLTRWMGFHAGNVSNQNKAEEGHTTHNLDWISCRQCQQSISSRGGPYNSPAGWDFTQAMSAIKIKQRRATQLTCWMGFHTGNVRIKIKQRGPTQLTSWMGFQAGNVSPGNQLYDLLITSCSQYSDINLLSIQSLHYFPLKFLIKLLAKALVNTPTY